MYVKMLFSVSKMLHEIFDKWSEVYESIKSVVGIHVKP